LPIRPAAASAFNGTASTPRPIICLLGFDPWVRACARVCEVRFLWRPAVVVNRRRVLGLGLWVRRAPCVNLYGRVVHVARFYLRRRKPFLVRVRACMCRLSGLSSTGSFVGKLFQCFSSLVLIGSVRDRAPSVGCS
jgi:hypothetical protein